MIGAPGPAAFAESPGTLPRFSRSFSPTIVAERHGEERVA